ncbi:ATP-binding protein [Nocardioides sp.]|uniref:ATP-binding protein n=1 Tax=Nocardioides sp. TaxID=35761 RepID=UPI0027174AE3|nr:ATP-binding protein [Nocardioides sp.]MDO9455048.1 ATP-binding protein [Nocardioides sp.]
MPLNRPALSLGAGPRGVQDARRWVVGTFRDIGRDDLVECAEMAVSEVVTNALLHGSPPIQVRVRGTREHPRVEVSDGSQDAPSLPSAPPDLDSIDDFDLDGLDDMLLTFGRGLSIVARASDAWGAEIEDEGKTVWFTPASSFSEDSGAEGVITGTPVLDTTGEQPVDPTKFRLVGVPVRDYVSFHNHFRELRREVRLLAMANEADYPLARDLAEVFHQLGRPLTLGSVRDEIDRAQEAGEHSADLEVLMGREEARGIARFIELLALTDAFAREEKMLALARTPRQVDFQTWFLSELVHQAEGEAPRAWVDNDDSNGNTARRSSVS